MDKELKNGLVGFFSKQPINKFKRGRLIGKPGQNLDMVGMVKTGYVRAYTTSKTGQEITIPLFDSMFYVTYFKTIVSNTNGFSLEAISEAEVWMAPKKEFQLFCKENPEIQSLIDQTTIRIFGDLLEMNNRLVAANSLEKVAIIIQFIADSDTDVLVTHKMIASLTGLTRETVTIQILKLEKMKVVINKGRRVKILNRKELEKIIEK